MKLEKFYVSCTPGFEEILGEEISSVWGFLLDEAGQLNSFQRPELVLSKGGVSFEAPLVLGLQLNFFLKSASRILLRIGQFKADRFDIFQMELKRIIKNLSLSNLNFDFKIETLESRLNHKKNIEEAMLQVFKKGGLSAPSPAGISWPLQKVFVRIVHDRVTLSLDTSGEHLHKRGWGQFKNKAPLRETYANAMLQILVKGISAPEIAESQIVDPFVGSGTLLLEAASFRVPFFRRQFIFQKWSWSPQLLSSPAYHNNYLGFRFARFQKLIGQDIDPKEIVGSEHNFQELLQQIPEISKSTQLRFQCEDSFQKIDVSHQGRDSGKLFLVSNLPYGERVKKAASFEIQLVDLVSKLKPDRACFLGKNLWNLEFPGMKIKSRSKISNQGIDVELILIEKSSIAQ